MRANGLEAQLELLKHVDELLAVNQFDGRHAVAHSLFARAGREAPRGENDALVCAPHHGAPRVAHQRHGGMHRLRC